MTRPLVLLPLLLGCSGQEVVAPMCSDSFVPDPWDPVEEPDVRSDETTASWEATGGATVDTAATEGCGAPPCLSVSGLGGARTSVSLNRGETYTLTGTVVTDVDGVVNVTQYVKDGPQQTLAEIAVSPGTTTLEEALYVESAGPEIVVSLVLAESGVATLDDFALTGTRWAATEDPPAAPVRLGFLIHVEENGTFTTDKVFWKRRAMVLEGVSATLGAHGARLGVQADASFIRGAAAWDESWIADREAEGAGWSVHIHDETSEQDVEQAFRDGRTALREAGASTTDLNGGFNLAPWLEARSAGFQSLTAYKDPTTQLGPLHVQVQPWRPADGVGANDPEAFLAHDPDGPLLYLPGHDVREVVHARFPEASANVMSQVLAHAREGYVNTWYFVLHVDGFGPEAADEFDAWIEDGGLDEDLAHYDAFLTEVTDPLVDEGLVVYDTPDGMWAAWDTWNAGCGQ